MEAWLRSATFRCRLRRTYGDQPGSRWIFRLSVSPVHLVKLTLLDASGKMLSDNLYWRALPARQDDLTELATLPMATLDVQVTRQEEGRNTVVLVTLHNRSRTPALMAHLQLRRRRSGERVLPAFYSDNYVSLLPGETKTVRVEAERTELRGEQALIVLDGWNVGMHCGLRAVAWFRGAQRQCAGGSLAEDGSAVPDGEPALIRSRGARVLRQKSFRAERARTTLRIPSGCLPKLHGRFDGTWFEGQSILRSTWQRFG